MEPDWERDAEISFSPIPKITVKHIGDTTPVEFLTKSQYIKNLRKFLPPLVLWLLTEVGKHTCINSRSHRVCGSAPSMGQEGGSSVPPSSPAKCVFCEGHCLLPRGFGRKADDFIACFDNKEIQCRHGTSRFCHSVLPPREWDHCFFGSKLLDCYSENGIVTTSLSFKSKATIRLFLTRSESLSQQKSYIFSSKQEQNICRDRAPGHMYFWWSCW